MDILYHGSLKINNETITVKMCGKKISLSDLLIKVVPNLSLKGAKRYIYEICFNDKYIRKYFKQKNDLNFYIGLFGAYMFLKKFIGIYKNKHLKINNCLDSFLIDNKQNQVYFYAKSRKIINNIIKSKYLRSDCVNTYNYNLIVFFLITVYRLYNDDNIIKYMATSIYKKEAKNFSFVQVLHFIILCIINNLDSFPSELSGKIKNKDYDDCFNISTILDLLEIFKKYTVLNFYTKLGTCAICYETFKTVTSTEISKYINTDCLCKGDDKLICFNCIRNIYNNSSMNGCPFCRKDISSWISYII
jgi:hypothetical protein